MRVCNYLKILHSWMRCGIVDEVKENKQIILDISHCNYTN